MKKRKFSQASLFVLAGIPYAFLAMYADKIWNASWFYSVLLGSGVVLGILSRKESGASFLTAGCIVSAILSVLCAVACFSADEAYFKPFGATGWVLVLSFYSYMIQYLVRWAKRERETAQNLVMAFFTGLLILTGVAIALLLIPAREIGAI